MVKKNRDKLSILILSAQSSHFIPYEITICNKLDTSETEKQFFTGLDKHGQM